MGNLKTETETHAEKDRLKGTGSGQHLQAREWLREATRGGETGLGQILPANFRRTSPANTLIFGLPASGTGKGLLLFKPPNLWSFVLAAPGNQGTMTRGRSQVVLARWEHLP